MGATGPAPRDLHAAETAGEALHRAKRAPAPRISPVAACRLDFLHLQCRAWTGRVVAAVYVALSPGSNTTVSWDPRSAGQPLLAVRQAISRFYDALDPTSASPEAHVIVHWNIAHDLHSSQVCMSLAFRKPAMPVLASDKVVYQLVGGWVTLLAVRLPDQIAIPAAMCELEVQLVSEAIASAAEAALPPINALRNLALSMADSEVRLPTRSLAYYMQAHPCLHRQGFCGKHHIQGAVA